MMNIDKSIRKIIGKPKAFGGRKDWDGDGVPNKRDCQPRNVMRQDTTYQIDVVGYNNYQKILSFLKKNNIKSLGTKQGSFGYSSTPEYVIRVRTTNANINKIDNFIDKNNIDGMVVK